jgi:AraC-like DNA-binding protein
VASLKQNPLDHWDTNAGLPAEAPPYHEWRGADIARYIAERHTDPGLRIADAVTRFGVTERTIRRDLAQIDDGAPWGRRVRRLRIETARKLLAESGLTIVVVARKSGYDSPTSFTAAFKRETGLSPVEWRRGKKGPARAGGPTGAARRPAQRAKALEEGLEPPSMRRPWGADSDALLQAEIADAETRLREERRRGVTFSKLSEEVFGRRGVGRSKRKR